MARMYHDADANLALIQSKKVGVIGWGSQAPAQAPAAGIQSTADPTAMSSTLAYLKDNPQAFAATLLPFLQRVVGTSGDDH